MTNLSTEATGVRLDDTGKSTQMDWFSHGTAFDDRSMGRSYRVSLVSFAICAVLFAGTLVLFSRALPYGFTNYDDPTYITGNPHVQGGLSLADLTWAFTGRSDYWHPLTWISHMADWQWYGQNARGHRLTSIIWHALNAVLLFFVALRISARVWIGAFCAAVFAWHPLRVESVIWVTERKDVMSGCFFLLTLWAYLEYATRKQNHTPRSWIFYSLSLAAYMLGLMSKPTVVTAPGVLLLLDFWPLRRIALPAIRPAHESPSNPGLLCAAGSLIIEKIPFFALSLVVAIITIRMQTTIGAFTLDLSLQDRAANALVAIPRYVGKFFWPADLAVAYPHPGHWNIVYVLLAALFFLSISVAAWLLRVSRPSLIVGWGWFLLLLLPAIGIIQVGFQSMADRYTYIAGIGLELAVFCCFPLEAAVRRGRFVTLPLGAVALGGLLAMTWHQERYWKDPETLFRHTLAVTRNNYAAHFFLGMSLMAESKTAEAATECERAVALNPDFAGAVDGLAMVRRAQGRTDEAIAGFHRVLQLQPDSPRAECDLATLLLQQNRIEEAAQHLENVRRHHPDLPSVDLGMAQLEQLRGHAEAAIEYYKKVIAALPNTAETLNNYALLLAANGHPHEAEEQFKKALAVEPTLAGAHANYGNLLLAAGKTEDALAQYRLAIEAKPDNPAFYLVLARNLESLNRNTEAIEVYKKMEQDIPGNIEGLCAWGDLLLKRDELFDARERYTQALALHTDYAPAMIGLAKVADALGEASEAIAQLRRAAETNAKDAAVQSYLGDAFARHGQVGDAEACYLRGLAAQPQNPDLHAKIGFVLLLAGKKSEAIHAWNEALRLKPDFPGLRERIEQLEAQ